MLLAGRRRCQQRAPVPPESDPDDRGHYDAPTCPFDAATGGDRRPWMSGRTMSVPETLSAADLRALVARLPRRAASAPAGHQPAERLPRARRRHRAPTWRSPSSRSWPSSTGVDDDLAAVCQAIAHGSLMGARGNSGVILSPDPAGPLHGVQGRRRRDRHRPAPTSPPALAAAADAAYGAVMRPVEGTILTVVREASVGADRRRRRGGRRPGRRCSTRPATRPPRPLADTPEPAARAGRGRRGRRRRHRLPALPRRRCSTWSTADRCPKPTTPTSRRSIPPSPSACSTCTATATTTTSPACATRSCTSSRHPTRPSPRSRTCGPASATRSSSSAATASGTATSTPTTSARRSRRPSRSAGPARSGSPTCSSEVEEERWVREAEPSARRCPTRSLEPVETAVVAVATGDGIRRIFHSLGVQGIVTGGQTMNPSTAQLLEAVEAAPPTTSSSCPTTRTSSRWPSRSTPTPPRRCTSCAPRGIAEGFASLLAYDPEAGGRRQPRGDGRRRRQRRRRRGHPGRARLELRPSARSARATSSASCGDGIRAVAPTLALACEQLLADLVTDEPRARHHHRGRGLVRRGDPPHRGLAAGAPPRRRRRDPPRRPAPLPVPVRHRVARSGARRDGWRCRRGRFGRDGAPPPRPTRPGPGDQGPRHRRGARQGARQGRHRDGARPAHLLPPALPRPHQGGPHPRARARRRGHGPGAVRSCRKQPTRNRPMVVAQVESPTAAARSRSPSSTSPSGSASCRRGPRRCSSARSRSSAASAR